MSDINRAEILKQMGITQWVLRDAGTDPVSVETGVAAPVVPAVTTAPPSPEVVLAQPEPVAVEPAPSATADIAETPRIVSGAVSLEALRVEVQACEACGLSGSRSQTVFGSGPERSDWLFVGEAPGQQEDRQGLPFVGRAGSLLTQMLLALGQPREQVYISNTLKCRPPGNRDPMPDELAACEPFLLRQIEFLQPKVIVALGRISAQALLKTEQPLGRMRGQVYRYGPDNIPLIVTYHPAYLLRNPADKHKVWEDLLLANRQMAG